MTTEELKTFVFLSKVKNFTLAAEQLEIAQSTVTNRIRELEKEVGRPFFDRTSKTVRLTEEGEIFLHYAERILDLQESSFEEISAVSAHRRKFSIGAVNATYELYVKDLADKCLYDDQTSVKVVLGHSPDLVRLLQDRVLDIVFSLLPIRKIGYTCDVYAEDELVLVCAKGINQYPKGILKSTLPKIPFLMCDFYLSEAGDFIRSLFPKNHVFKFEIDNTSKLLPYLEAGHGYAFLPYNMVKDKIEAGILEKVYLLGFEPPKITTYLIYRNSYDAYRFLENK